MQGFSKGEGREEARRENYISFSILVAIIKRRRNVDRAAGSRNLRSDKETLEERKWEAKWLESGLISMQNARVTRGARVAPRALHLPETGSHTGFAVQPSKPHGNHGCYTPNLLFPFSELARQLSFRFTPFSCSDCARRIRNCIRDCGFYYHLVFLRLERKKLQRLTKVLEAF